MGTMMDVKRWTLEQIQKSKGASMLTDGKGAYVLWRDYAALRLELEAERTKTAELEREVLRWKQIVTDDQEDIDNARAEFTGLLTVMDVYGDSYGVPTIDVVCGTAATKMLTLTEQVRMLATAIHHADTISETENIACWYKREDWDNAVLVAETAIAATKGAKT